MSLEHLKNKLVKQFLCATQISAVHFDEMTDTDVSLILDLLTHDTLQNFPLKTPYVAKFLKKMINQMEKKENELCDEIYYKYIELIQKDPNEGPFYKHYAFNSDETDEIKSILTIQESTSIVSHGTTGLCTWQAGIAMACWCLRNKHLLDNRVIMELGCGTGLSGLSACINCKPREYWFTDCHSAVLDVLKNNIQVNQNLHTFNCKFKVVQLSWDNIGDVKLNYETKPDLVLAADVVFDQNMFDPLCDALKWLMMNGTTEIYLFCTQRNPETFKTFQEKLKSCNLNFKRDILPDNYSILLQQDCPIYVIHIK
ncbi:protein-lysine N-methyltransferase EEF2KMT [Adelges cooleyi]|uniref:protein-lysine N-methyltransferase EEF2KMT n=1 Tax=Adelges cooleyi TaxID=133065 RepID=UPI00217F55A0|nr:protein-lysine N-methyltransferase EEF2KMT [Adelges cooleyi]